MVLGTAHHFAIGSGAFDVSRVFSNFKGIGGWAVKPLNAWFSAPAVGSKPIFSKMLTYNRAYSGVKIIIVCARPGPQL